MSTIALTERCPFNVIRRLPAAQVHRTIAARVDLLQVGALARIQAGVATHFFDGMRAGLYRSTADAGELFFHDYRPKAGGGEDATDDPPKLSEDARRGLMDRLLGKPYSGKGCGLAPEVIKWAGVKCGVPVEAILSDAKSLSTKRLAMFVVFQPMFHTSWSELMGEPPPTLPREAGNRFSDRFVSALSKARLPEPERYHDLSHFNDLVDEYEDRFPELSFPERVWVANWELARPFFPSFDRPLRLAADAAVQSNDPQGSRLKDELDSHTLILRAVRRAGEAEGWPNATPEKIIARAARRLAKYDETEDLTADGLAVFLDDRRTTVDAICRGWVGAGWLIWQSPEARPLADALIAS